MLFLREKGKILKPQFKNIIWLGLGLIPFLLGFNYNMGAFFRDAAAPPILAAFSAVTGSASGQIDVTVTFPGTPGINDYKTVDIRRLAGGTAPNAACTNGSVAKTYSAFGSETFADTGLTHWGLYSYRACIYDAPGNLTSSQTLTSVRASDNTPPAVLTAFTAVTGSGNGRVSVTVNFPGSPEYDTVDIRQLSGATAPNVGCTNGTVINSYSTFTDDTFDDTGLTPGGTYSYRACLYDAAGNLTSSQTVAGVLASVVCGGDLAGPGAGYCWFLAGTSQNCTDFCNARSATCVLAGLQWGASASNCPTVGNAVIGTTAYNAAGSGAYGCWKNPSINHSHLATGTVTCGGSFGGNKRYCACTN
jgi:hypothetical protein